MTWALIDARAPAMEIGWNTRIAGLTFAARHARTAARRGFEGALFLTRSDEDRAALRRAVAAQPPPSGFPVEHVVGDRAPDDARDCARLRLHAVYTPDALAEAATSGDDPPAAVEVHTPADLRAAEGELVRQIRKTIDADGLIAYYTQRPIARLITRLFVDTPITPNQVTLGAMACGIGAAICAAVGGAGPVVAAGILYWFGAVVDCVDGDLARLRVTGSRLGEWLDTLADDVSTFALVVGLGVGLARDGYPDAWMWLGIAAAGIGALGNVKIYRDLHRAGSIIDTAYYPWFFGAAADRTRDPERPTLGGRVFHALSYLFRRDAYVTVVGTLLVLQLRRPALVVLIVGISVIVFLLLTHLAVTRGRDR